MDFKNTKRKNKNIFKNKSAYVNRKANFDHSVEMPSFNNKNNLSNLKNNSFSIKVKILIELNF